MKRISFLIILFLVTNLTAQEEKKSDALASLSMIGVTIGGNFIITGTFPSYVNERVDQFVTRIFNEAKVNALLNVTNPVLKREIVKEFDRYSFRNITLKRISGEELKIDLLKFRRTGDYSLNPYLKHDDVIIFPYTDVETNFFTVSGAVMVPGKFHYMEGDKLGDAIVLAGGINKAYENVTVKIFRASYDGGKVDIITPGMNDDFMLQMGDRIVLDAAETARKDFNVFVLGEVNNPGKIPVSRNSTTLKEAIERAGGLKATASLKNSRLYTGNTASFILEKIYGVDIKNGEYFDIEDLKLTYELADIEKMMMYRLSSLTEADTGYFSIENQLRILTEGSSIDFSKIDDDSSESGAYTVRDGDIIIIPRKQNTVYLFGSVVIPGHVPYEEGKDAYYYIKKAGGLGEYAEDSEIMVIKGSSRKWIPIEEVSMIEDGDYIYVPRDPPHTFNYYVDIASRYLGILGSAATVILLLVQFGK